jgi:hypothetical protein
MKSIEKIVKEELEDLLEIKQPLMNYLKQKLPNTPEHVVKDMIYPSLKDANREEMNELINDFSKFRWELKRNFPINYNIFSDDTIRRMKERKGGSKNPYGVPRDEERHETQKNLILKRGMPQEPIIMFYDNGKYELWEGWHRTMQLLQIYPQGYVYPNVYVGYNQ